jgi:uncharacterized lipoprotein YajG
MRTLLIAAGALALAGCQTDIAIQQNLPSICSKATTAHAAFQIAALTGVVSDSVVRKEARSWAILEPLCRNPEQATTAEVLIAAIGAAATIQAAMNEAK